MQTLCLIIGTFLLFHVKYFVYLRCHDKFYEMDSLEYILYILVGLSFVLRPLLKRAKEGKEVSDTQVLPDAEDMPTRATSWEDLMRELKHSTEQKEKQHVTVDEQKAEQPTQPNPTNVTNTTHTLKTNLSTEAKKQKPIHENQQDDKVLDDLNDVDDLRRAIIYTEILNRKEY